MVKEGSGYSSYLTYYHKWVCVTCCHFIDFMYKYHLTQLLRPQEYMYFYSIESLRRTAIISLLLIEKVNHLPPQHIQIIFEYTIKFTACFNATICNYIPIMQAFINYISLNRPFFSEGDLPHTNLIFIENYIWKRNVVLISKKKS